MLPKPTSLISFAPFESFMLIAILWGLKKNTTVIYVKALLAIISLF